MEDVIKLPARYGYCHTLEKMSNGKYQFIPDPKSYETYTILGFDGEHKIGQYVSALDPEGGPFMTVDSVINNKYVIKSITRDGIFDLVLKQ